ncbi:MAG: lactate utilization protein [Planctomycetes bacterium]|nr:lactate utilization protein [Planctomycetota bacterium]
MDFTKAAKKLEENGFVVSHFARAEEAAAHLERSIKGEVIGFGGSITLKAMALDQRLAGNNQIIWHWINPDDRARFPEFTAYITSVNALAETGELINIDGAGNRVAASLFGPKKVYFVVGINKLRSDLASAIDRARNIASPLNAKRLDKATPCVKDLRCHDCRAKDRICGSIVIHMRPMQGATHTEVVLIDEELGY